MLGEALFSVNHLALCFESLQQVRTPVGVNPMPIPPLRQVNAERVVRSWKAFIWISAGVVSCGFRNCIRMRKPAEVSGRTSKGVGG